MFVHLIIFVLYQFILTNREIKLGKTINVSEKKQTMNESQSFNILVENQVAWVSWRYLGYVPNRPTLLYQ